MDIISFVSSLTGLKRLKKREIIYKADVKKIRKKK